VAIEQSADPAARHPPAGRVTLTAFAIVLVCAVPVVAAAGLLLGGVLAVAPAEYLSPDLSSPILLRIMLRLLPELAAVGVALFLMQTLGGTALRLAFTHLGRPATSTLAAALRTIAARPLRPLGVAAAGLLVDAATVAVNLLLLSLLWPTIGTGLGDGLRSRPETVLLLLGFVAVWLGLLLAAGALHVAISAWWAMEVGTGARARDRIAHTTPAPAGPMPGTESGGRQ
jgi:hypothetical protein